MYIQAEHGGCEWAIRAPQKTSQHILEHLQDVWGRFGVSFRVVTRPEGAPIMVGFPHSEPHMPACAVDHWLAMGHVLRRRLGLATFPYPEA